MTKYLQQTPRRKVMYQIVPGAFADSNGDGIGDLQGIIGKLPYLEWLGVETLWLGPIFDSPLDDGGYDVRDYYKILPNFGSMEDFQELTEKAHQCGMKIIIDMPINHTSTTHENFQQSRKFRQADPKNELYHWANNREGYPRAKIIFPHTEDSNWEYDNERRQYYLHRFLKSQADLNYENPLVQQEALSIIKFWKNKGVDGFRLDAVPYLFKEEGTECEHLPKTHDFLKRVRREVGPETVLLAEADGTPEKVAAYVNDGTECNMAFNFPLMPQLFLALARGNRSGIDRVLAETPQVPDWKVWGNFLRNHDELTTIALPEKEQEEFFAAYGSPRPEICMWTHRHELRGVKSRLAELLGGDKRKIELLNAVLLSLPGTPVLYYGDEIGMGDNQALNDRDQVRTPMQWSAEANGGFSSASADALYLPMVPETNGNYHFTQCNVDAQQREGHSLLNRIQRAIAASGEHADVFNDGAYRPLNANNEAVFAYARELEGSTMLCLANLSGAEQQARIQSATPQALIGPLDTIIPSGSTPNLFAHSEARPADEQDNAGLTVTLPPYGWSWHHLATAQDPAIKTNTPASLPTVS